MVGDGTSDETTDGTAPSLLRLLVTNFVLLAIALSTLDEDYRRRALAFGTLAIVNAAFVYQILAAKIAADGEKHSMWISQANSIAAIFGVGLAALGVATWAFTDLARGEAAHAVPELVITLMLVVLLAIVVRNAIKHLAETDGS